MNLPASGLKQSLLELGDVLRREAEALQSMTLNEITQLVAKKSALVRNIDELSRTLDEGKLLSVDLHSEIERLRAQASANAEKLKSLAEGAIRAQKRLQALKQKDLCAGAYTASGQERRLQSSSVLGAKV